MVYKSTNQVLAQWTMSFYTLHYVVFLSYCVADKFY